MPRHSPSVLGLDPQRGQYDPNRENYLRRRARTSNALLTRRSTLRNAGNAGANTATQLRCLLLCHALAAGCHGFGANNCLIFLAHATMSSIIEQKAFA